MVKGIISATFSVIRKEPKLVIFPILSSIVTFLVLLTFLIPSTYIESLSLTNISLLKILEFDVESLENALPLIVLFLYYLVSCTIIVYFNSGLVACAYQLLNGKEVNIKEGFHTAFNNLGKIIQWALIAATVGIILKILRNRSKSIMQSIFTGIAGLAWGLLTYFVIPVMVIEKLGVVESIKRSGTIFKKTWGETFVATFHLVLITIFVLVLPGAFLIGTSFSFLGPLVSIGIAILYFAFVSVITSTLSIILRTALYIYGATGKIPVGYDGHTLKNAFKEKTSSSPKI